MKRRMAFMLALTTAAMLCACGGGKTSGETAAAGKAAETTAAAEKKEETKESAGGEKAEGAENGKDYNELSLKLGTSSADGSLVASTFVEYGKRLEEASGGKLKLDVYPGSVLGNVNEMAQSAQQGTLDFAVLQPAGLADMGATKMNLLTLPYLIRDYDHLVKVLFSEIGDELLQDITDHVSGLVGLGYLPDGGRVYFTKGSGIHTLEDLKNRKIRLQGYAIDTDTANALGFSATPVAFSEVYSSLDTGVVDGAENSISSIDGSALYEVMDSMTLDNHTYNLPTLLFSEKKWDTLTDDTRVLLKETWDEVVMDYYVPALRETEEELLKKFEENGVEIIREIPDKEQWVQAVQPVWEKYGAGIEDLVAAVQSMD